MSNKLIFVKDELYIILGTVWVDSGYSTDELKNMWALADTQEFVLPPTFLFSIKKVKTVVLKLFSN